jgi:hypothetical protein
MKRRKRQPARQLRAKVKSRWRSCSDVIGWLVLLLFFISIGIATVAVFAKYGF